jgi:hypothetical protein
MQRFTMDMITMLNLSHPRLMESFLRLRDKVLWGRFVMEFGDSHFGAQENWATTMPSVVELHENDPNLVATMRSALAIAGGIIQNPSLGERAEIIQKAFSSVAQQLTAVSGVDA